VPDQDNPGGPAKAEARKTGMTVKMPKQQTLFPAQSGGYDAIHACPVDMLGHGGTGRGALKYAGMTPESGTDTPGKTFRRFERPSLSQNFHYRLRPRFALPQGQ